MTVEETRAILHRRAVALARPLVSEAVSETVESLFLFEIRGEIYGIPSRFVQRAFSMDRYTPVPCTPDFVLGVTNLHGEVVSVIDLGLFLGQPRMALSNLNKVLVIEHEPLKFGLAIDEPKGVAGVNMAGFESPPGKPEFVSGLAGGVIVLDMDAMLQSERLIIGGA